LYAARLCEPSAASRVTRESLQAGVGLSIWSKQTLDFGLQALGLKPGAQNQERLKAGRRKKRPAFLSPGQSTQSIRPSLEMQPRSHEDPK